MNKQEQLMEYITQDVISMIIEDNYINADEAMRMFYNSELYEKIMNPETGLYLEGSAYIYDIYKNSVNGRLVQLEV